jgi:hypothetical protein
MERTRRHPVLSSYSAESTHCLQSWSPVTRQLTVTRHDKEAITSVKTSPYPFCGCWHAVTTQVYPNMYLDTTVQFQWSSLTIPTIRQTISLPFCYHCTRAWYILFVVLIGRKCATRHFRRCRFCDPSFSGWLEPLKHRKYNKLFRCYNPGCLLIWTCIFCMQ